MNRLLARNSFPDAASSCPKKSRRAGQNRNVPQKSIAITTHGPWNNGKKEESWGERERVSERERDREREGERERERQRARERERQRKEGPTKLQIGRTFSVRCLVMTYVS